MAQRSFSRQMRRGREWFPKKVTLGAIPASGQLSEILDTGLPSANKKDATIVRMLIDLSAVAFQSVQSVRLAMGISIMNADAHAAGALPDPGKQDVEDADWLWHLPQSHFQTNSVSAPRQRDYVLDIRSKRVYNSQADILVLVVDNLDPVNTLDVIGSTRVLVLDPP